MKCAYLFLFVTWNNWVSQARRDKFYDSVILSHLCTVQNQIRLDSTSSPCSFNCGYLQSSLLIGYLRNSVWYSFFLLLKSGSPALYPSFSSNCRIGLMHLYCQYFVPMSKVLKSQNYFKVFCSFLYFLSYFGFISLTWSITGSIHTIWNITIREHLSYFDVKHQILMSQMHPPIMTVAEICESNLYLCNEKYALWLPIVYFFLSSTMPGACTS